MVTLSSCPIQKYVRIVKIKESCSLPIKRRLYDLGFTNGQIVKKIRSSLLNKVVLIEIRGYLLSLRSSIANEILVEGRWELV